MSNFNLDNVTQINILLSPSLSSSLSPPPSSPKVAIYGFCMNFNRPAFVGYALSHIHVNMKMKMTGWLSHNVCARASACVRFRLSVHTGTLVADLKHRQYVGISLPCRGSQEALPPTPLLVVKWPNRRPTVMWKCRTSAGVKPYLCTKSHE